MLRVVDEERIKNKRGKGMVEKRQREKIKLEGREKYCYRDREEDEIKRSRFFEGKRKELDGGGSTVKSYLDDF